MPGAALTRVVEPTPAMAARLAALADAAFEGREIAWNAEQFEPFTPPQGAVIADEAVAEGLLILQFAADEAEILNFGVMPAARRRGLGSALLAEALALAALHGAATLFLEVAIDNAPARALYTRAGFAEAGRRRAYYLRPDGSRADALILSRRLDPTGVPPPGLRDIAGDGAAG
ncbi:MAG: GNAT family N-acetyltransferase [Pseudomonadota bacterium]